MNFARLALAVVIASPAATLGGPPWEKPPEKWSQSDAYRILQDSPWSPANVKLETHTTIRHTDKQTGMVSDSPVDLADTPKVPGIELTRGKATPQFRVLWWSSKTVRLAQSRLRALRGGSPGETKDIQDLPDYVLVIEGNEALRIFQDAREDLHDTVFLELPDGGSLDLASVTFMAEGQEARSEFHFPRQLEGRAAIDPEADRVVFHCKASAKNTRIGRDNAIAPRAEFKPRLMRVHGVPDF